MSSRPLRSQLLVLAVVTGTVVAGCGVPAARFPSDVQTAIARRDMRRMETTQLLIYYPEGRRELAERLAARLEACATEMRRHARIDNRHSREKMVVVVPEAPFNNAYVLPPVLGLEDMTVVPTGNTLDFTTTFGLPPDPGHVGCHEIVHYVHVKQIAGFWGALRTALGDLISPQVGLDPWFLEGLATYYEARLSPGSGRPRWPVFTGMFHAAYAGGTLGGGDLSEQKRDVPIGHHYLVGTMFIEFLAETYGEAALWRVIELQAKSTSVILSVDGRFGEVYGKGLGALVGEFRRWVAERYPVRARPPGQRVVRGLGDDARWAWGPNGEIAVIDQDVDEPARLRIWNARGAKIESKGLVDIVPPRRQVVGAPLLTSGMSFARDGSLWFTSVDLGGTFQTTRLFRWTRDGGLDEVAHGLGPGGAVSPDGARYFHMIVDGDRWSLAVREVSGGASKVLWDAAPGQFALRVQPSRDGVRLAVSVWDGTRFAVWVMDAATGARIAEHVGSSGGPVYDATFTDDGRLMLLDVVGGRFQVAVVGADGARTVVTDAPYGLIEAREQGGVLRFLARDGFRYTLDEVALPPPVKAEPAAAAAAAAATATVTTAATATAAATETAAEGGPSATFVAHRLKVIDDRPYSRFDGLFRPTLHTFAFIAPAVGATEIGLAISGGDRLDLVRWAAAGYVDPQDKEWSAAGGVILNDFAPWVIAATGQRLAYTEDLTADDGGTPDRDFRDAQVSLGRVWRGTYAMALGGTYAYQQDFDGAAILRLYGPALSLGYSAVEFTRATGPRRGIALTLDGAVFPRGDERMRDGRAELDLFAPLAGRHVIHANLRGHIQRGAPGQLITVGGAAGLPIAWSGKETFDLSIGDGILPSQHRFIELLRGFEDLVYATGQVALADVSWRYTLMIDRGTPALGFLPATFLSQIELEPFFTAARFHSPFAAEHEHSAVGGVLTLRLSLFRVPLAVQYQASRRLTDDEGFLQLVMIGPGV